MTALVLSVTPYVAPYIAFARTSFINLLAYRARYFVGVLTYFFNVSVWYFIWKALFAQEPTGVIGGFDFPQMVTYVSTGWALRSFYFNEVDRDIASQVQEGRLAMSLIKPVDFQAMALSKALGESAFRLLLFSLPIATLLFLVYPLRPPASFLAGLLFGVSGLLSVLLVGAINFCVGLIAIRTRSILGFLRAKYLVLELLSGLLIPPTLFPERVRPLLDWLPFPHMNYTPGRIYLGLVSGAGAARALALQAAWALALLGLGRLLWRATRKRIVVQGG
ncbi:MAG TPA: ABC-2 family transporter protein [Thermoanaerobaculia bacterium]